MEYLAGISVHIFFKVRLKSEFQDTEDLSDLTEDGYITNRADLGINGYAIQFASDDARPLAKINPSDKFFVTFQKVARGPKDGDGRINCPAYGATFEISCLTNSNFNETHATSLEGIMQTGQNFTVPFDPTGENSCIRYKLTELNPPDGYVVDDHVVQSQFKSIYDYYIFEIERTEKPVGETEPKDYLYIYKLWGFKDPAGKNGTEYQKYFNNEAMSDDAEAVVIEWEQDQANTGNVDFVLPTDILIELYVDKTWYDKNNELNIRPDEVLVDIVQRKGTDKKIITKSLYRLVISLHASIQDALSIPSIRASKTWKVGPMKKVI